MAWVAAPTNKLRLHFIDYNGKRSTETFHLDPSETDPNAGGAAAIAAAAQGCSDAELSSQEILVEAVNTSPGSPTTGPYARGADKLLLVFNTAGGVPVTIELGAPKETDLADDHINVNPADTNIASLVSALIAHACDDNGNAITSLQRGYRRRPPRRKHQ